MPVLKLPPTFDDFFRFDVYYRRAPKWEVDKWKVPSPEDIALYHKWAATSPEDLVWVLQRFQQENRVEVFQVILMAIDPDTGNSLLHTAFAAKNLDCATKLLYHWRNWGLERRREAKEILVVHQNHVGDSILHIAVRSGEPALVLAALRALCRRDLLVDYSFPGTPPTIRPIEDTDWTWFRRSENRGEWSLRILALLFFTAKNSAGRDAEAEARVSGNDEIIALIDKLVNGMDFDQERNDPLKVKLWKEGFERHYALAEGEIILELEEYSEPEDDDEDEDETQDGEKIKDKKSGVDNE